MSTTSEDKENTFRDELLRIFDRKIREFTRLCVVNAPDYFYEDCPASSSGKYHPISELGPDGCIIHTKKVFTVAYELCKGFNCEQNRDVILASCLIHDLRKQGYEKTGHTQKRHPEYAACLVDEVQNATKLLDDKYYQTIRSCVGYHYGPWSIDPWKKPLEMYTPEEYTVYVSDYVASKRFIHVDYRR